MAQRAVSLPLRRLLRLASRYEFARQIVRDQPWLMAEQAAKQLEAEVRRQASFEALYQERLTRDRFRLVHEWWGGQSWLAKRPGSKFVFIVGCGHSGTSLLLRLLAEHPQVYAITRESALFYQPSDSLILQGLLGWEQAARAAGKSVILEKTPDHLFCVHKLNQFVPRACVLCMMRDGRDVVASLVSRGWDYEKAIHYWTSCMSHLEELKAKVNNLTLVHLAQLVRRPEQVLAPILAQVGLEHSPQILSRLLNYHHKPAYYYANVIEKPPDALEGEHHVKMRNFQINQPLSKEVSRWQRDIPPEKHTWLQAKLQPWLAQYGY